MGKLQICLVDLLLDAEAKLGEILVNTPKESGKRTDLKRPGSSPVTRLQNMGITKKESHLAQVVATNPVYTSRRYTLADRNRPESCILTIL